MRIELISSIITAFFAIIVGYWGNKLSDLPERVKGVEKDIEHLKENVHDLKESLKDLKEDLRNMAHAVGHIKDSLLARGIVKPSLISESPKKITEFGHEILKKISVNEYLKKCDLINDWDINGQKEDLDIYIECLDWVKNHAQRKVIELSYNSNLSQTESIELLAVAIRDEILNRLKKS